MLPMTGTIEDVRVDIALPLPLDVVTTLTKLISVAYGDSRVSGSSGATLSVIIPAAARLAEGVSVEGLAATTKAYASAAQSRLVAVENGSMRIAAPQFLAEALVPFVRAGLDGHPEATNYLEWQVLDGDGTRYVLSAARSHGQTPAQMHRDEKSRADAYAKKLRTLGIEPEHIHP